MVLFAFSIFSSRHLSYSIHYTIPFISNKYIRFSPIFSRLVKDLADFFFMIDIKYEKCRYKENRKQKADFSHLFDYTYRHLHIFIQQM